MANLKQFFRDDDIRFDDRNARAGRSDAWRDVKSGNGYRKRPGIKAYQDAYYAMYVHACRFLENKADARSAESLKTLLATHKGAQAHGPYRITICDTQDAADRGFVWEIRFDRQIALAKDADAVVRFLSGLLSLGQVHWHPIMHAHTL